MGSQQFQLLKKKSKGHNSKSYVYLIKIKSTFLDIIYLEDIFSILKNSKQIFRYGQNKF